MFKGIRNAFTLDVRNLEECLLETLKTDPDLDTFLVERPQLVAQVPHPGTPVVLLSLCVRDSPVLQHQLPRSLHARPSQGERLLDVRRDLDGPVALLGAHVLLNVLGKAEEGGGGKC
jgi:hypothetical protein